MRPEWTGDTRANGEFQDATAAVFPHGGGASLATLATLGSDAPPGTFVLPGGRPR